MVIPSNYTLLYALLLLPPLIVQFQPTFSFQFYDKSSCTSKFQGPGSKYLCNSKRFSCRTFIIYRAQTGYQTLSSISSLFNVKYISDLLSYNNISQPNSIYLPVGREIIIPITCHCPDRFSYSVFAHNASILESLSSVACGIFQGLVKAQSLIEENPNFGRNEENSSSIQVPIRCACPDSSDVNNGIKYLVTYPIMKHDSNGLIARKFGVAQNLILDANGLDTYTAIYPETTLLIPTKSAPNLNLDAVENPSPPRVVTPWGHIVRPTNSNKKTMVAIFLGVIVATTALVLVVFGVFTVIKKKNHINFGTLSRTNSRSSNFSPDFLDGMSKLKDSLICFSLEELRVATEDFSDVSLIGSAVYRGRINDSYLAIEEMSSMEAAQNVVCILTKTNHLNVVKLVGFCYGVRPFLLFEFAENCSLRDCLSNLKLAKQFDWRKRMQIAFDISVGVHYIHYSTKPTYMHRNINSRNILVTADWRAKISGFRLARPLAITEEMVETDRNETIIFGKKGYLAPEYLKGRQASAKVDVYAFGVVLLELLSGKEAITDEKFLKDSVNFLCDEGFEDSSGCLEKMKGFMDPVLNGDYQVGDAMGLAFLAKACVEDEALDRPTMNDVLKVISRML